MKPVIFFFLFSLQLTSYGQLVGINMQNPFRARLEVQGGVDKTVAIFGTESTGVSIQKGTPTIGFNHYYNTAHRYIGSGYAARQFVDQTSGFMAFELFGSGNANNVALSPKRVMTLNQNGSVYI